MTSSSKPAPEKTAVKSRFKPGTRAISNKDKNLRRREILQAALTLFYLRGFQTTKMDEVAKLAGVSKGTIYLYFDSKDEVFLALIEEIAIPKVDFMEQRLSQTISIRQIFDAMFQIAPQVIRHSELPKLIKILISDAHTFPDIINTYREHVIKRMFGLLTGILKTASDKGEISIENPELCARLVVAPIVLSMLWVIIFEAGDDRQLDIPQLLQQHKAMLLKGMGLEPES